MCSPQRFHLFFFNDTATTEIYTLSLHDALPISALRHRARNTARLSLPRARLAIAERLPVFGLEARETRDGVRGVPDRKSTRLNSSHSQISYAVFCLKKKKNITLNLCIRYKCVVV